MEDHIAATGVAWKPYDSRVVELVRADGVFRICILQRDDWSFWGLHMYRTAGASGWNVSILIGPFKSIDEVVYKTRDDFREALGGAGIALGGPMFEWLDLFSYESHVFDDDSQWTIKFRSYRPEDFK